MYINEWEINEPIKSYCGLTTGTKISNLLIADARERERRGERDRTFLNVSSKIHWLCRAGKQRWIKSYWNPAGCNTKLWVKPPSKQQR